MQEETWGFLKLTTYDANELEAALERHPTLDKRIDEQMRVQLWRIPDGPFVAHVYDGNRDHGTVRAKTVPDLLERTRVKIDWALRSRNTTEN